MKGVKGLYFLILIVLSLDVGSVYEPDQGTVALWHFDECAGNIAEDSSLMFNGNDGILNNVGWSTDGRSGCAVRFNNTGIISVQERIINIPGEITLEAWVKRYANQSASIISKNGSFYLGIKDNKILGGIFTDNKTELIGTSILQLNQWYHLAMVYNRMNISLYVNGTLDNMQSKMGDISTTSGLVYVGWAEANQNQYFNGLVDEARISNASRTDFEITTSTSTTSIPPTTTTSIPETTTSTINITTTSTSTTSTSTTILNPVNSCGDNPNRPGVWEVSDTLYSPDSNCLEILSDNVTLECHGNLIHGSGAHNGITINGRNNVTIKECRIDSFEDGIFIDGSIGCSKLVITSNSIKHNGLFGILGKCLTLSNISIKDNEISYNGLNAINLGGGLSLVGSGHYIKDNSFGNNSLQDVLIMANNVIIYRNWFNGNRRYLELPPTIGIKLLNTVGGIIDSNYIRNYDTGIKLTSSNFTTIKANSIWTNRVDINIDPSNYNLLFNNEITGANTGILIINSTGNQIYDNQIRNNKFGINLTFSYGNLIFNNYWDNMMNNAKDNGINEWNTTKHNGTSISGGVTAGGNFWHDYEGVDSNGDDIADSNMPYNSNGNITNGGDFLPLINLTIPVKLSVLEGFALVSLPMRPLNRLLPGEFNQIKGNYSIIWTYNSSDLSYKWASFNPGKPALLNTLQRLDESHGFWINFLDNKTLNITFLGRIPVSTRFVMKKGFNLIGYPSLIRQNIATALADVNTSFSTVFGYNASNMEFLMYNKDIIFEMNTLKEMLPFSGYWVNATTNVTWVFSDGRYRLG